MNQDNITDIAAYLRAQANELGSRILEMYPPLQSTTGEVPPELWKLLRTPLPAQTIAIGGLAKYLRSERAARIVAECGAGKTYMALGLAHVLQARTILVMCPSHIAKKWAREAIQTIPFVRIFLVEDMRNGGDPRQPHGVLEVCLRKGRVVYEGMQLSLAELRHLGRTGWMQRVPRCTVFIIPKDKGKLYNLIQEDDKQEGSTGQSESHPGNGSGGPRPQRYRDTADKAPDALARTAVFVQACSDPVAVEIDPGASMMFT